MGRSSSVGNRLQRIQASSTAHRLSERNCVELVSRLLDMGLVEVVHTLDGKEYVTLQYLEREIREELTAHRGQINVVDLQQVLNVDLTHIESKVAELLKHNNNLVLIQGKLIDRSYMYMDRLCEELNDTLQEVGQMSVSAISKNFGLPNDFLVETFLQLSISIQEYDIHGSKVEDIPAVEVAGHLSLSEQKQSVFVSVSDLYVPTDDGLESRIFVSTSYHATTHFETTCEDVVDIYQRVTGQPFDFSTVQSQIETAEQ